MWFYSNWRVLHWWEEEGNHQARDWSKCESWLLLQSKTWFTRISHCKAALISFNWSSIRSWNFDSLWHESRALRTSDHFCPPLYSTRTRWKKADFSQEAQQTLKATVKAPISSRRWQPTIHLENCGAAHDSTIDSFKLAWRRGCSSNATISQIYTAIEFIKCAGFEL